MFHNNNKGFYAFLISGFYLKEYNKMQKHDKEFFINHFKDLLTEDKNNLIRYVHKFSETNAENDFNQIIYCTESICFHVDLLEILKE